MTPSALTVGPGATRDSRGARVIEPAPNEAFHMRSIHALRHTFHLHPLMELPALAGLAKRLIPTKQCRFVKPGLTADAAFQHEASDHAGRSIDEVFERLEEPASWLALYNVETDPEYRGFLDEVTHCVRGLVEPEQSGIRSVGGFIFISAPPSVTPFHIDRENNFWLQVRGRKIMNVWDAEDREAVAGVHVDNFIAYGGLDQVKLRDGVITRSREFDVGAGDGVYFPATSPHMTRSEPGWAKPGDGISISIGVVCYTDQTRQDAYAHAGNLLLRKLGLSPQHPRQSALADAFKRPLGRGFLAVKSSLQGYKPTLSF